MLVFLALQTGNRNGYWSASIGRHNASTAILIYADHWTTKLSYVCQYHSKSLTVWSKSVDLRSLL